MNGHRKRRNPPYNMICLHQNRIQGHPYACHKKPTYLFDLFFRMSVFVQFSIFYFHLCFCAVTGRIVPVLEYLFYFVNNFWLNSASTPFAYFRRTHQIIPRHSLSTSLNIIALRVNLVLNYRRHNSQHFKLKLQKKLEIHFSSTGFHLNRY